MAIMQELGNRLKSRREELGLTLRDIEQSTKIGLRLLQKMEAGEFGALPGGIFARNFLRQYCAEVELDPGPFLDALGTDETEEQPLVETGTRFSPGMWAIVISVICLFLTGWFVWQQGWLGQTKTDRAADSVVSDVEFNAAQENNEGQPVLLPRDEQPVEMAVTSGSDALSASESNQEVIALPETADQLEPEGEVSSAILRFQVSERCWVHLRCPDRDMDFMLESGESYVVTCGFPVRLTLGNAGAVTLTINGHPVSFPSESRVLRDFEILSADVRDLQ